MNKLYPGTQATMRHLNKIHVLWFDLKKDDDLSDVTRLDCRKNMNWFELNSSVRLDWQGPVTSLYRGNILLPSARYHHLRFLETDFHAISATDFVNLLRVINLVFWWAMQEINVNVQGATFPLPPTQGLWPHSGSLGKAELQACLIASSAPVKVMHGAPISPRHPPTLPPNPTWLNEAMEENNMPMH